MFDTQADDGSPQSLPKPTVGDKVRIINSSTIIQTYWYKEGVVTEVQNRRYGNLYRVKFNKDQITPIDNLLIPEGLLELIHTNHKVVNFIKKALHTAAIVIVSAVIVK